jgi:excisionase family DNA binding protein
MIDERWLTVADIADQLQVDEQTVRRWIRGGKLVARQLGGKAGYRIRPGDLRAFLDALPGAEAAGDDQGKMRAAA